MKPFVFYDRRVRRWFITISGRFLGSLTGYHRQSSAITAAEYYTTEPS